MFLSDAVCNGALDSIETTIGAAPIFRLYNGTPPASASAALSGNTLIAEGTLPSDWMAAASGRSKGKSGTWTVTGQSGAGAGTDVTFGRIYASDGVTPHMQFTAGLSTDAGPPEAILDNKNIATGQVATVNSFNIGSGN